MTSATNKRPTLVGVGGFSSNAGKTTLVCELLRAFPGWEAIKMTRGHYRSCGKDAHACCVSGMLAEEPVVRSGRAETYAPGKDTGRYWEAGASNVHWVIVTDKQVEAGFRRALARIEAEGVFVEGNSFLKFVEPDFVVTAARVGGGRLKPSARRVLAKTSALYLFEEGAGDDHSCGEAARARFTAWGAESGHGELFAQLPTYTRAELPALVERIRRAHAKVGSPRLTPARVVAGAQVI